MAVALSTIIFSPLSASPGSDASVISAFRAEKNASFNARNFGTDGDPDDGHSVLGGEWGQPRSVGGVVHNQPRNATARDCKMGAAEVTSRAADERKSKRAPSSSCLPGSDAAVSERGSIGGLARATNVHNWVAREPRSETCRSARRGLAFYVRRANDWRRKMGQDAVEPIAPANGRACPYTLWRAKLWRSRSFAARQAHARYLERRTLRDFAFAPGADAWPKAVREVQRVFPGTEGWLLSCSAAEGGHGRWVGYGGQGYSTWLRDSDTVGGPLQFRFSTFTGMYRRSVEHARSRGFRVELGHDRTAAWRSALGQALAGGWARYTGNDNSHWSASFGRGC